MRRKVLLAAVCWLSVAVKGEEAKTVNSAVVLDNESAESAPRLYREAHSGVYASSNPYGAYSFHAPAFQTPPKSGVQYVPVKQEKIVVHNQNGYLKDSYGNKFVQSPHSLAYKMTFPQQYVQLQDLPKHLAQPLVAASPGFHFQSSVPHFSYGAPIRLSSLQAATPTPIVDFHSPSHAYAENIKSLAPTQNRYSFPAGAPQQQSSNHKVVYSQNFQPFQRYGFINQPKFQRLQEISRSGPAPVVHGKAKQVQPNNVIQHQAPVTAQAKQVFVTYNNGKKTVVSVDTKPPIPQLLDLSLLEPLTFANPIVPQVQHFLPKINYPLPLVDEEKKQHKEIVVQKTKYYDTGNVPNEQEEDNDDDSEDEAPPPLKVTPNRKPQVKTSVMKINVNGQRGSPEFSYEINAPNFKETYNEQVLSYDKKTETEPVSYSYNEQSTSKPVTYSFSSQSQQVEPLKQVQYEVHSHGPNKIIYTSNPQSQKGEEPQGREREIVQDHQNTSGESENSEESDDESPRQNIEHLEHEEYPEITNEGRSAQHLKPEHREEEYHHKPHAEQQRENDDNRQHHREEEYHHRPHPEQQRLDGQRPIHKEEYHPRPLAEHQRHDERQQTQHSGEESDEEYYPGPPAHNHQRTHANNNLQQRPHPLELNEQKSREHEQHRSHPQNDHPRSHPHNDHPRSQHIEHHHRPQEHTSQRSRPHENHDYRPQNIEHHHRPEEHTSQRSQQKESHRYRPEHVENHHRPQEHHPQRSQSSENEQQRPQHIENHSQKHHHQPHAPEQFKQIPQQHHSKPPANIPPHLDPQFDPVIVTYKPQHHSQNIIVPVQNLNPQFQPITPEYDEEDITILSTHKPHERLKEHHHEEHRQAPVPHRNPEPQHHISGNQQNSGHHHTHHKPHPSVAPDEVEHFSPSPAPQRFSGPAHVQEKSRKIIIQEETPDEMHSLKEQMIAEMVDQEENNEEDFENAFKEAAFGFPGYAKADEDAVKDIYNPETYGVPRQNADYDFVNSPFQEYTEEGDEFPKSQRLSYKDERDKTKDNYFLDYSSTKPLTVTDRFKHKEDYYKNYKAHRPEHYFAKDHDNGKKNSKKSEKYTAAPDFSFGPPKKQKPKKYFAEYKEAPKFEYDYSKEAPRDSFAYASRPSARANTLFVEPQFQYGFEPIAVPHLFDSELSAMASNDNPESEKPGTRKKIYKENWYIKKTSTSAGKPNS